MPDEREKELRKRIRRLTKQIGEAIKNHDHNEVENLRMQRSNFIGQLIDEYEVYYWVENGQSKFGTQEEAYEHYEQPENQKKLAVASAITDLFQGRTILKKRFDKFAQMNGDDVKELILGEVANQIVRVEKTIHEFEEESGMVETDFEELDKKQGEDDDFLDGIDISSLV